MKTVMKNLAALALLCAAPSLSAVELPEIISDNAVFQQNSDARLWGWSKPGKKVTVTPSWDGKAYTATAGKDGRWSLTVKTPGASFTPWSVTFDDGDKTTINNVLIGEVWLATGQSNMEMPLRGYWTQPIEGAAQTIAYSGKYPGIRVVTVPKKGAYTPQERVEGKWKTSSPANAGEFTALGYHFAQSLTDILNVPVGIISCAYGGAKAEGYMPKDLLDTYPDRDMAKEQNDTTLKEYERIGVMYNAMLHPIIGYTIRGFLWNQGESNVGRHAEYPQHQKDMVERWRKEWGNPGLPFYFVEMPPWNYGDAQADYAARFRECQHKAAEITPNSGVVCTTDVVYPFELEDVHASNKKDIGERLAFMAASRTYNIEGIPATYPRNKSMTVEGNKATLTFENAADGFTPNDVLEGFEAAGEDRVFHPANATEDYDTRNIIVTSDEVPEIKAVRYCFRNFAIGKVKNLMGMPLIPFRTDNWE